MNNKIKNILYLFSGIITTISVICYIFNKPFAVYTYTLGVIGMILIKISTINKSNNFRIKRLNIILTISSILFLVTTYLMYTENNIWAITLILAAIFDLIVSLRMPNENKK